MTDKEIIQALRCCKKEVCADGGLCPLFSDADCIVHLCEAVTDLIERLTAENVILPDGQASAIETLRKEIEWKDMVIALAQRKQAEAEAERDALLEKKRWILVSKKEPEYDMPQLAMTSDGEVLIANYAYGEWFDTWGQDVDVTHWMPLPEAPEEGEKA